MIGKVDEWEKKNNFESKLLKAVKARKEKANDMAMKLEQHTLDGHLQEIPQMEQVTPYSNSIFREAAIKWHIATDQVCI